MPSRGTIYAISRDDVTVLDDSNKPCKTLGLAAKVKFDFAAVKPINLEKERHGRCVARRHAGAVWSKLPGSLRSITRPPGHPPTRYYRAAASVGEDPARFGSHSLRSGGATALFNAGVDSLAVKKFGRWKSDAVERYTVLKDDLTASLARSMLGKHA
ncbi:hypothetical protein ON010_g2891 [Phytophthora cinnamomi]|nr:hypothetical protein ON010_g2891 [Phytophthora cinnamomi]